MSEVTGFSNSQNPEEARAGGLIDLQYLGLIFLFVLALSSIFEIGLLIFAYVNADKVECNLLWCTFTSGDSIEIKNSYSNYTQSITSTSQCFVNGVETNCSDIKKNILK
jgi:hypothetical protein